MMVNKRLFYSTLDDFGKKNKPRAAAEEESHIKIEKSFSPAEFCPTLKKQRDSAPYIINGRRVQEVQSMTQERFKSPRSLLKHKRYYRPDLLTTRERQILANPSPVSRLWMGTVKPVYLFVTRRILGWADREGAADRDYQ